jgi:hypothetical protein
VLSRSHPGDANVREQGLQLPRETLGTLAQGPDIEPPALRTGGGDGPGQAAVVAPEPVIRQVEGQPGVAVGAVAHPATGVAGQHRRETAPVEEEEHLITGIELLAHQPDQHRREATAQGLSTDVQEANGRRRGGAGPFGQLQALIATDRSIAQALQGGRRRAQHQGTAGALGAPHRQVPGRVAETVLLLEGEVVFLVHQDESQARQGHEDRRAGAQHQIRRATGRRLPGPFPLRGVEGRMQDGQASRKAARQAAPELGGEADLRHQQQGLTARLQHPEQEADIDLGLAATGNPLQQKGLEAIQGGAHRRDRLGLARVEFRPRLRRLDRLVTHQMARLDPAPLGQGAQGGLDLPQPGPQPGLPQSLRVIAEQALDLGLTGGARPRRLVAARGRQAPARLTGRDRLQGGLGPAQPGRQGGEEGLARGLAIIVGGPENELQVIGAEQGLGIEQGQDGLEPVRLLVALPGQGDDHAHPDPGAEGHLDAHPRLGYGTPLRLQRQIIEKPRQGDRDGDTQDNGRVLGQGARPGGSGWARAGAAGKGILRHRRRPFGHRVGGSIEEDCSTGVAERPASC